MPTCSVSRKYHFKNKSVYRNEQYDFWQFRNCIGWYFEDTFHRHFLNTIFGQIDHIGNTITNWTWTGRLPEDI